MLRQNAYRFPACLAITLVLVGVSFFALDLPFAHSFTEATHLDSLSSFSLTVGGNKQNQSPLSCVPRVVTEVKTLEIHVPLEPVVMVYVMMGMPVAHEGSVAIKTALMHTSRPLQLHIVCTDEVREYMEKKFALFSRPAYNVEVVYYPMTYEDVAKRGERAGVGRDWWKMIKLFIHELLVDVDKAIFVDTDMEFVVDPLELWNEFKRFDKKTIISLPIEGSSSHPGRICSCVMLMDLKQMRAPNALFLPSTLLPDSQKTSLAIEPFMRATEDGVGSVATDAHTTVPFDPMQPQLADQGIIYVIWNYRPELFVPLPIRWNISPCRKQLGLSLGKWDSPADDEDITEEEQISQQRYLEGTPDEHTLVSPGMLHFNCMPEAGEDVWTYRAAHTDEGSIKFGAMTTVSLRYRWVWLNRGDGTATVRTRVMRDIRWWDELVAQGEAFDLL